MFNIEEMKGGLKVCSIEFSMIEVFYVHMVPVDT